MLSLRREFKWNKLGARHTAIFVWVIWFSLAQATTSLRKYRSILRASRFSSGSSITAAWAANICWSFGTSERQEKKKLYWFSHSKFWTTKQLQKISDEGSVSFYISLVELLFETPTLIIFFPNNIFSRLYQKFMCHFLQIMLTSLIILFCCCCCFYYYMIPTVLRFWRFIVRRIWDISFHYLAAGLSLVPTIYKH